MKLKELQEKRNTLAGKIRELRDAFTGNGDKWKDDEQRTTWETVNRDYDAVGTEIGEARSAEDVERRAREVEDEQRRSVNERRGIPGREDAGRRAREGRNGTPSAAEDRQTAVAAWFKRQAGVELTKGEREACRRAGFSPARRSLSLALSSSAEFRGRREEIRDTHPSLQKRGLTVAGGAANTIPEGFVPRLERSMLAFGGMLQVSDVLTTDSGNDLPWPTANDTGNTGELLAEATSHGSSVDPSFGAVTLGAFKFSSKLVKVSTEIMEDSAFDLNAELSSMLGERLGRVLNSYATTGTGSSQPNGIATASGLGKTAAGTTAVTGDELIELVHSVDPAYRSNPGVRFMMHDNLVMAVRKLKDSDGQYLWQPGLQLGVADRLLGYAITVNQAMASAMTASAKTILFGDLSKYKIRLVRGIRMKRLVERYADTDEEGFIAYLRADGDLLDAGTDPVKHLIQAAS